MGIHAYNSRTGEVETEGFPKLDGLIRDVQVPERNQNTQTYRYILVPVHKEHPCALACIQEKQTRNNSVLTPQVNIFVTKKFKLNIKI